ncbi:MAG: ATP-binding protein [Solirubrobacterales bacterium]|nr:ATP-binding protein [Solirubrobacterales bacterium]
MQRGRAGVGDGQFDTNAGDLGEISGAGSGGLSRVLPGELRPQAADVGRLFRRVTQALVRVARAEPQPSVAAVLGQHLGLGARGWPVVGGEWAEYDHVNVQAAVDAWLADAPCQWSLVGVTNSHRSESLSFEYLLVDQPFIAPRAGNVAMIARPSGPDGEVRMCVRCGLWLIEEAGERWAMLLSLAGLPSRVRLEILRGDAGRAGATLAQVRRLAVEHNVYRGHVVGFEDDVFGHAGGAVLSFLRRPRLAADELVLADGVLDLVERQVLAVARHREKLRSNGQHLKRGVLLYGPPGSGKTHTVRYLLDRLEGVTVVLLSGRALSAIREACSVARALAPAAIVVEDVDLIAEDRGSDPGRHPLLFQLLNEMDGLGEDVDVAFILTTNRVELLEPALAARPGRVDQAINIALPDIDARRRLLELYRGDLEVRADLGPVLERTEGVTASFLKELMRRCALAAAEECPPSPADTRLVIDDRHFQAALDELLDDRHQITRSIIGGVVR